MKTFQNLKRSNIKSLNSKKYFSFQNFEEFYNSSYIFNVDDLICFWSLKSVYKFVK